MLDSGAGKEVIWAGTRNDRVTGSQGPGWGMFAASVPLLAGAMQIIRAS